MKTRAWRHNSEPLHPGQFPYPIPLGSFPVKVLEKKRVFPPRKNRRRGSSSIHFHSDAAPPPPLGEKASPETKRTYLPVPRMTVPPKKAKASRIPKPRSPVQVPLNSA